MNKRTLIACFILMAATLACNLPAGDATSTPEIIFTETPTLVPVLDTPIPTLTSLPTNTPLPTLTSTPTIPVVTPVDKNVNCRLGPGTEWSPLGALQLGESAAIQGRNEASTWWYITAPNTGKPCYVAASVTLTSGNLANLPLIPLPVASVTDVTLKLDPKEISLPGCIGPVQPIKINGTIETNGPTDVKYYFKTEQGGDQPIKEIEFDFADSKKVEATYTPPVGAGSFWVRLIIVSPGDKTAEATYKIVCP